MAKFRRILLVILFFTAAGCIIYGVRLTNATEADVVVRGHRFVGSGIVGLFFLWMPLFIYHRWKGKDIGAYMLNEENIRRMKDFNDNKNS